MLIGLWIAVIVLAIAVAALLIKIHMMRVSAGEIERGFEEKLATETNTLIDISSGDRYMRRVAAAVNAQLRRLREDRRRFRQGDKELKNAVTNISHDLRTPLTAIRGYVDLLEGEEKSEAAARYTGIIKERTEMLSGLTEELFRYSMILAADQDMKMEPVALNSAIEESAAAFYADLRDRGIEPEIEMPETGVERMLDASALSRVFSNILNNAVKYSDGDLKISLKESGEIVFSNTASELDEVRVGRLFDRFYTVETAGRSTGLGLAIARTLTEQMGGTIDASYIDGRLYITLYFPTSS